MEDHAIGFVNGAEHLADRLAERVGKGIRVRRDDADFQPALDKARGALHADEARASRITARLPTGERR